jgi:hypothetical protein
MMREQHSLVCEGEPNPPDPVQASVFDLVSAKGAVFDAVDFGELFFRVTTWLSQHFYFAANVRGEGIGHGNLVWLLRANSLELRDHAWRLPWSTGRG